MRSSVASVFAVIHQDKLPLAATEPIKAFFQAKQRKTMVLPNRQDEIWDIRILLKHIKAFGDNNETMDIKKLQIKAMILLCIATMWRPSSDIGQLKWRNIEWIWNGMDRTNPEGVYIISENPKEQCQKRSTLAALQPISNMCPVSTLFYFMGRTFGKRQQLDSNHTLFLAYLEHPTRNPRSVQPSTIATMIQKEMANAGINTSVFKAHSIRSASSSAAYQHGIKREVIKKHANWSLNTDTFERHYLKRINPLVGVRQLLEKLILDTPENDTTSEVEAEASPQLC
jgi:integrase